MATKKARKQWLTDRKVLSDDMPPLLTLQEMTVESTMKKMIMMIKEMFHYGWDNCHITVGRLQEFPQSLLEDCGIFINFDGKLFAKKDMIFIDGSPTIELFDNDMKDGKVVIKLYGSAKLNIKSFGNSRAIVITNDGSSAITRVIDGGDIQVIGN